MVMSAGMSTSFVALLVAWLTGIAQVADIPACDSQIWCQGQLLHDVQMAQLFKDSKTFVDMSLKVEPDTVLEAYKNLTRDGTVSIPRQRLKSFVKNYFNEPGTELEHWDPPDYIENPSFLSRIVDADLRQFGKDLCRIWSNLGRKISEAVKKDPDRFSLIDLDNPFIVPGGRFREIYYWDSYWVVKGLLICQMDTTVKGMLENQLSFIKRFGLVPNGGRKYYIRRSQPPFLTAMVDLYVSSTGDVDFLQDNVHLLLEEYNFWQTNRNVSLHDGTLLNRYAAPITTPRPESFFEDSEIAAQGATKASKEEVYSNLASAAESGWDFTSRWFSRDYTKDPDKEKWLAYIDTKNVLPVDLNSILCWNERLLSQMFNKTGNQTLANHFFGLHQIRTQRIHDVFWDETLGSWFDLDIRRNVRRQDFYPSNVFPLFTRCLNETNRHWIETRFLQYIKNTNVLQYQTGVPTSFQDTGQQWDYPNNWPPLEHAFIMAVAGSSVPELHQVAQGMANKWVNSIWLGWNRTHKMFEKYVVTAKGSRGGGGEYNVQEGFGWTNGAILDLLDRYGPVLKLDKQDTNSCGAILGTRIAVTAAALLAIYFML